jgi:hypothetical protein
MRQYPLLVLSLALLVGGSFASCSKESAEDADGSDTTTSTSTGASDGGGGATTSSTGGGGGGPPIDPTVICTELGLESVPFADGPYGTHRGDLADDFTVPIVGGRTWNLRDNFSGCETYVFSSDRITVSDADDTSVWENDLDELLEQSPQNVHYFFFSRQATAEAATTSTTAMQARIDEHLATLPADQATHWQSHLHVISTRAQDLEGWLGEVLDTHGRIGLGIDRSQIIRGAGYLADVNRFSSSLNNQGLWPWKNNLAYVAHEPRYFNAQHERLGHLKTQDATTVTLWEGEVLSEFAETTVTLPSAAEMETFDTFEVEIEMQCPDPDKIEIGNCGAWDYLAYLFVKDELGNDVQLARFITAYHRETHWVADATPMMVHLLAGGERTFKWSFAPPWNVQPTATKLRLHFSNQNKGYAPRAATYLYSGGAFNDLYNDGRLPVDVPISATAAKVELFAITTGHGAEAGQCAEFCNHQHEFTVDGNVHMQEFPEAQTEEGCVAAHEAGMVPNQAGTWWYGRGGWCPGQQVAPFVVDVTNEVTLGGTAQVTYRGLYNDATPTAASGNIDLVSYIVVYE